MRKRPIPVLLLVLLPCLASAQTVISARAGMIYHTEGRVLLDGEAVVLHPARFLHAELGERLRTEAGGAEMMLAVGSFLRLAEHSEIELVSAGLTSASVRFTAGSAILDVLELFDPDSLAVLVGDARIQILKAGRYRFDARSGEAPTLKVYQGNAVAVIHGVEHTVTKKRSMVLADSPSDISIQKFKPLPQDPLDVWNDKRAAVIADTTPNPPREGDAGQYDRVLFDNLPRYRGFTNPGRGSPQVPQSPPVSRPSSTSSPRSSRGQKD